MTIVALVEAGTPANIASTAASPAPTGPAGDTLSWFSSPPRVSISPLPHSLTGVGQIAGVEPLRSAPVGLGGLAWRSKPAKASTPTQDRALAKAETLVRVKQQLDESTILAPKDRRARSPGEQPDDPPRQPPAVAGPAARPPSQPPLIGKALVVDQAAQVVRVYQDGIEIRALPASTGLPRLNTYTPAWQGRVGWYVGTTYAYDLWVDYAWYLFRAGGDILIHGAPYEIVDGQKVYQDIDALGVRPASHGCIRLHPDDAVWLAQWNPQGAAILITPWNGKISP